MQKRTQDALQHASSLGYSTKHVGRTAYVYEGKPIHCANCGYTPYYSLRVESSYFCPCCGRLVIDARDLEGYNVCEEDYN